jgi:hypothetical protein
LCTSSTLRGNCGGLLGRLHDDSHLILRRGIRTGDHYGEEHELTELSAKSATVALTVTLVPVGFLTALRRAAREHTTEM